MSACVAGEGDRAGEPRRPGGGGGEGRSPREKPTPKAGQSGARRLGRKMEGPRGGVAKERAALCVPGRLLRLPRAFPVRLPSPPPPVR